MALMLQRPVSAARVGLRAQPQVPARFVCHAVEKTAIGRLGLVARLTEKLNVDRKEKFTQAEVDEVVKGLLWTIVDALAVRGERISIPGFGSFEVRARAARNGRNPRTGEVLSIGATKVPAFTASKTFKDSVKSGGESAAAEAPKSAVATPAPKKPAVPKK